MSPAELRTVDVSGGRLEFHLRRSSRRRTLEISVNPDQRVTVTAPTNTTDERVMVAVRRRAGWIRRQQRKFEDLPPPSSPKQWMPGETHRYLGRQYRLKVVQGRRANARLSGSFFIVTVPHPTDRAAVQRAMERWYRLHAITLLADRLAHALESTTWLDSLEPPTTTVRAMRQRWGSTTGSKRVYFNTNLIKLPLGCIEYVVMHELVHLKIPHHGSAFWRLLSRCMPDWETWKDRLAKQDV